MTGMFSPARLLPAAGLALLCLVLALGYASAQSPPPAAPAIDSVSSGDTTLTVAWTAPVGETGITAYDVRHIETSADETVDANWTVEDNAWTFGELKYAITGLINGTEYDVQVRAVNSNGDGTWSATEVGTPALPAPNIDSVRADDRAVLVSWSSPTGITTGVAAYDVRYVETSGDETVDSNWTVDEDVWKEGGGSLAYAVTGLTNGTGYDVQVRAVDVGDGNGAWSATTSANPADHGDTHRQQPRASPRAPVCGESLTPPTMKTTSASACQERPTTGYLPRATWIQWVRCCPATACSSRAMTMAVDCPTRTTSSCGVSSGPGPTTSR